MGSTLTQATLALLLALLMSGCQTHTGLGGLNGPQESCGNGQDDDNDGLLDEDCPCGADESQACFTGPYPSRLIGACRDGQQQCSATGSGEFGSWQECIGDALPTDEVCEGAEDEDCDGAIDEGCPCETEESRACGIEFAIFPCRSGIQTCAADLRWSGCEGAIGPEAELCSDALDNDCDGIVNEGCECIPAPEVCGDGADNDCDGEIDEPACGTCEGERCGELACGGQWHAQLLGQPNVPRFTRVRRNFHALEQEIAYHPSGVFGFLTFNSRSPDQRIIVALRRTDGTSVADVTLESDARTAGEDSEASMVYNPASIFAEDDGFWIVYRWLEDRTVGGERWVVRMARIGLDGSITVPPTTFGDGLAIGGVVSEGVPYLSYNDASGRLRLQPLDEDLQAVGSGVDLGQALDAARLRPFGPGVGVIGLDPTPLEMVLYGWTAPGGATRQPLGVVDNAGVSGELVHHGTTLMACWSGGGVFSTGAACRRGEISDAMLGPAFEAPSVSIAANDCGFHFIGPASDSRGGFEISRLLPDDSFERSIAGWAWAAFLQVGSLHASDDGGLLYTSAPLGSTVHTLPKIFSIRIGPPRTPDDCDQAQDLACQLLRECCPGSDTCQVHREGGVLVTSYNDVSTETCEFQRPFCSEVNTGACVADLEAGLSICEASATSAGGHNFYLPASCKVAPPDPAP